MIYTRVLIPRCVLRGAFRECYDHPRLETGGVICGYLTKTRAGETALRVTHLSEGGPQAMRRDNAFERDTAFCQMFLDNVAKATGGTVDYVGEWHKHPTRNLNLSPMDIAQLRDVETSPDYATDQPLFIIVSMPDEARWKESQVVGFTCWGGDALPVEIEVFN